MPTWVFVKKPRHPSTNYEIGQTHLMCLLKLLWNAVSNNLLLFRVNSEIRGIKRGLGIVPGNRLKSTMNHLKIFSLDIVLGKALWIVLWDSMNSFRYVVRSVLINWFVRHIDSCYSSLCRCEMLWRVNDGEVIVTAVDKLNGWCLLVGIKHIFDGTWKSFLKRSSVQECEREREVSWPTNFKDRCLSDCCLSNVTDDLSILSTRHTKPISPPVSKDNIRSTVTSLLLCRDATAQSSHWCGSCRSSYKLWLKGRRVMLDLSKTQ